MSKEEIDIVKKIWWSVHKEDHECVKDYKKEDLHQLQKGGLLSPYWEKGVQAFQKLIIQATMKSSKIYERKKKCLKK